MSSARAPMLLACLSLLAACGEDLSRVQEEAPAASTAGLTVDWKCPTVEVFEPASHALVSGTVPVRVRATDNVAVPLVELFIGDQKVAESHSGSLEYAWDSTQALDGWTWAYILVTDAAGNISYHDARYQVRHYVQALAYDAAGNVGYADGALSSGAP